MANQTFLHFPVPTLDVIGWENDASISGSVTLTLPTPGVATGNTVGANLTLPTPTLAVAGNTGINTNAFGLGLTLPTPTLAVTGTPGVIGAVALTMPSFQLVVRDPDAVALTLPTPTLAVTGATGVVGSVSLVPPTPQLSVVGAVPFTAGVNLTLLPKLAVVGSTGAAGGVALALRTFALATSGVTGIVGNVAMTLPVLQLVAGGGGALIGSATLTLPLLVLQVTGQQSTGANFTTTVMHTETSALTTYSNYPFNSFAQFNGVYLGASDNGIFALTGATDDGTLISAAAQLGVTDFATSHLKRIDRCYIGYRTDGNMVLRVTTDEATTRDYLLTATGKSGLHGNHVRIGKGLAARYWQFEILNKDGADFELDMLEIKPTPLRRRIGGGDA